MSSAAATHEGDSADLFGATASPLQPEQLYSLAECVLRDAGGSLPSARKVRDEASAERGDLSMPSKRDGKLAQRSASLKPPFKTNSTKKQLAKRLAKASKKVAPAGVSSEALKAAARAFVEKEASSSGRGLFAVAADDSVSLLSRTRKKKKRRDEGEDDDAHAAAVSDDDDDRADKITSKRAKKKKKRKNRAEREAAAAEGEDEAEADTPPPPPPPQTPAAATRQLRLPAPVTLASPRIPSGDSAPQAAAAASAAAAAPETLPSWRASAARPDAKRGRLSSAEKEALVSAAKGFARSRGLSTDDLSWLFGTRTGASRDLSRGAWSAVAAALPARTAKSVYAAGTRLLHPGNYGGAWSADEVSRLRSLVAGKGNRWAEIGGALGRLPEACRDRWKELRGGSGGGGEGGGGVGGGGGGGAPSAAAAAAASILPPPPSSSASAPAPPAPPAPAFNSKRWAPDEVERLDRAVRADLATKAAAAAAFGGGGDGGGGGGASSASASRLPPAGVAASVVGARAVLDGVNWSLVSSRCVFGSPGLEFSKN